MRLRAVKKLVKYRKNYIQLQIRLHICTYTYTFDYFTCDSFCYLVCCCQSPKRGQRCSVDIYCPFHTHTKRGHQFFANLILFISLKPIGPNLISLWSFLFPLSTYIKNETRIGSFYFLYANWSFFCDLLAYFHTHTYTHKKSSRHLSASALLFFIPLRQHLVIFGIFFVALLCEIWIR